MAGGKPLSLAAARGEAAFRRSCASCHTGRAFTDLAFHRLAGEPAVPANGDFGLARVSGRAEDRGRFRTPSLRNVALTAPYLHDGSVATIAEAITRHGLPLGLEQTADIETFLHALTDRAIIADPRFARPGKACERS